MGVIDHVWFPFVGHTFGFIHFSLICHRWRWIGLDPDAAKANNEDRYVIEALERLDTWNPSYKN